MAHCVGCGAETGRVRVIFRADGNAEECDKCKPDSFEPRWKHERGAMGWEAYPEKYIKKTAPDGNALYIAKDEFRQDTQDWIANAGRKEEEESREKAVRRKREARRTLALSPAEIEAARLRWARP